MKRPISASSKVCMFLVFLFLYLPIFVLIFFSFTDSKFTSVFTGYSLRWYRRLFSDESIFSALGVTLFVAVISSVAATVIGTAAAVGMSGMKKWQRTVIMNITYVPVVNPEIVTGVSMMLLFAAARALFGEFRMGIVTLIIAHITFNIPYIIFSVSPKLRQMDRSLYEAAMDLGCNERQAFVKIVIPEILPGIVTGFLMALTYSIDDFVISYFTAGTVQSLPIAIYSMTRRNVSPEINALSTVLFVVVLGILLISNIRDINRENRNRRLRGGA